MTNEDTKEWIDTSLGSSEGWAWLILIDVFVFPFGIYILMNTFFHPDWYAEHLWVLWGVGVPGVLFFFYCWWLCLSFSIKAVSTARRIKLINGRCFVKCYYGRKLEFSIDQLLRVEKSRLSGLQKCLAPQGVLPLSKQTHNYKIILDGQRFFYINGAIPGIENLIGKLERQHA